MNGSRVPGRTAGVTGDFPDAKGAVSVGVEDALRAAGRAGVGEAGLAAGGFRRRGGGSVGEARDEVVLGEVTLPGVRRSVGCARSFVREAVTAHSRLAGRAPDEEVLDDLVTVASETVSNAVTHTASGVEGGEVTVVVSAGDGLYRLEVADDGAAGARPHVKAEVGAESGRGMRIVEALASRWGFRADGHRTVVWAEFPVPAARGRDREPFSGRG
ncbi:hypothetical protein GCM10009546_57650 [Actinomadura livida]|uniref:Histidine kinase/HSP90-like ATPase domain-containing protein n=1 Tax=Actinomadura livida TaxID=79909 RepID=A0ABN1FC97_9ACTN|nr:hypothetical protein GCM10010208_63880 [Actinomadura livida]